MLVVVKILIELYKINFFLQLQEEFDKVIDLVDGNVTSEEMQFFEELHQYLLEDEGSWAIGDGFLSFVGRLEKCSIILSISAVVGFTPIPQKFQTHHKRENSECIRLIEIDICTYVNIKFSKTINFRFFCNTGKLLSDQKFPPELRLRLLNVLAVAALKEDIILVLHQDRREHVFMNYANNFDRLPIDEQKALALFVSYQHKNDIFITIR